jgi:type VI secretion system protein VasI
VDKKKIAGCALVALLLLWGIGRIASSSPHVSEFPSAVSTPTDKWHLAETRSPMDDSKTEILRVDAQEQIQGPVGAITPSLIVRCKEKKTDVYVETGMAASIEERIDGGPSEFHKVRLRLDDSSATYDSWSESTDHKALFVRDMVLDDRANIVAMSGGAMAFAKKLASAKMLRFEFTPFNGSPQVMHFDLRGLDSHLNKVAEACGWSSD